MQTIIAVSMIVIGYLSGSVNYAIVVTRAVAGVDIRALGSRRPGTANVGRNVGKGWAALVFFLDLFKGLGPMLLAAQLLEPASPVVKHAVVGAVGAAAIVGHARPVFFGFRGGGGIATTIGVLGYFVPVELLITLALGFALAMAFFREADFTIGQWTPILSLTILHFLPWPPTPGWTWPWSTASLWAGTPGRCRSSSSPSPFSSWSSTPQSCRSGWARSARSRDPDRWAEGARSADSALSPLVRVRGWKNA